MAYMHIVNTEALGYRMGTGLDLIEQYGRGVKVFLLQEVSDNLRLRLMKTFGSTLTFDEVEKIIKIIGLSKDPSDEALLQQACQNGDIEAIIMLAQTMVDYDWSSGLSVAVKHGHINIVKLISSLLDFPSNVWNSLVSAPCVLGDIDLLKYLVDEMGADIHFDNDLAAYVTGKYGHVDILEYLMQFNISLIEPLVGSACGGHIEIVKLLISRTTFQTPDMFKAFMQAVSKGHLDIVQYLTPLVDIETDKGLACRKAASFGHLDVVKWLIEHQLRFVYPSNIENPFVLAAKFGHFDIVRYLQLHTSPNTDQLYLAFTSAAFGHHYDIAKHLYQSKTPVIDAFVKAYPNIELNLLDLEVAQFFSQL